MSSNRHVCTTTPSSDTNGRVVEIRHFKITDIPCAMDNMGWPVAAALMRHWFAGDPWPTESGGMSRDVKRHLVLAEEPYVEDSIIKMSWALQFGPVRDIVTMLRKLWNSESAKVLMRSKITKHFSHRPSGAYPLIFDGNAKEVEAFSYSNSLAVEFGLVATTDELRAALANFNVRVFPEGIVNVSSASIEFHVDRIGFYVEDAYDFNDDADSMISQPLGYWNFDGIANPAYANMANVGARAAQLDMAGNPHIDPKSSREMYKELEEGRYFYVSNSDFVSYRARVGKGGDFRAFSDVMYESISPTTIVLWKARA